MLAILFPRPQNMQFKWLFLLIHKPENGIQSILLKSIKGEIDVHDIQFMLLNMNPKLLITEFYSILVMSLLNKIWFPSLKTLLYIQMVIVVPLSLIHSCIYYLEIYAIPLYTLDFNRYFYYLGIQDCQDTEIAFCFQLTC